MTDERKISSSARTLVSRVKSLFSNNKAAKNASSPLLDQSSSIVPDFASETAALAGGAAGDGNSLSEQIWAKAKEISAGEISLHRQASGVSRAISERRDGSVTMIAWGIRFIIAILFGGIALQLVLAGLSDTSASQVIGIGLVQAEDIRTLTYLFAFAATIGLFFVFLGGGIVSLVGKADNKNVRREASEFGETAAKLATRFDQELKDHRAAMDTREPKIEAVSDLSRAHLVALEAAVYFRNIEFLISNRDARDGFSRFLRLGFSGGSRPGLDFQMLLVGFLGGAFLMVMWIGPPDVDIELPDFTKIKYPMVDIWIVLGSFAYLFAGFVAEVFGALFNGPLEKSVREEALEAARSGFVAGQPPRIEDVIQRIEDALEVYKARVGAQGSAIGSLTATAPGGRKLATTQTDDVPHWRRPKEGPRFVDPSFDAAPKSWRTDAYAQFLSKKSSPSPDTKRSLLPLKKPQRD